MRIQDLAYAHPEEACAQRPAPERDQARMLVAEASGTLRDDAVENLPRHVRPGDVFVLNDSRVQPARIDAVKDSGGRAELLILNQDAGGAWRAMIKSSHAPRAGHRLTLAGGCRLEVTGRDGDLFLLREESGDLGAALAAHGRPPLPPYIRRAADDDDVRRYQTTFARATGEWGSAAASVAAPTAGLHLTPALMARMEEAGARIVRVTLGVGPGTFRPIETELVEDHRMHEERVEVSAEAAEAVNCALATGGRITAVGTTSLRVLEAAASPAGRVRPVTASTGLFCVPGTRFRVVSRLLTNFHRPQSTLLALVAAFAGAERALELHRQGVARGYRLFSYGDATLVERSA